MIRFTTIRAAAALGAAAMIGAATANADTLKVFDQSGGAIEVDTASISGCEMVFDSAGAAFEICRLEKVELRPPQSTRVRPGQSAKSAEPASFVYKKSKN